jgi:Mg2+-importing ATPase
MFGGMATSLGAKRGKTAYDEGIASVSRLLLRLMVVMAPLVLVINGLTKGDWLSALLFSLSVAVGLTPEMLPMIVMTCLAKGAVDLSRDRVIVKRLDAIQNLGAMDVLCTDKTGTLTEDHVVLERHLDLMGREDPRVLGHAFLNSFFETGVRNLIDSAIISRATEETARGVPGIDADELSTSWHLVDEVPFDFERRRVSVVVENNDGRRLMVTKGAIEEVLGVCTEVEYDGSVVPLGGDVRERVLSTAYDLADKGMRVLGVARKEDPAAAGVLSGEDEHGMTLIGYLAFLDPPKRSAAQAVAALREHGVATKVLTGDSLRVACTVCETIGLDVEGTLDGAAVAKLSDEELSEHAEHTTVFAKLSPDQKVRVVRALRSCGHVVGFMGDGVNDAAAMGASDCGVSVDSGADVAKEAADIILLEKDLGVLERGIVAGRRTFFNMNKYVKMTASSNFGNIFSVLVASVFLPFLPMTAVQLLLLNFIYDCACAAIPWDSVDARELQVPQTWRSGSIASFMRWIGPTSSVFDVVTFALLFFWVCPSVAGGSWQAIVGNPTATALFAATFQAGWFVESMCTQVLFVHLVRTERIPFVQSMADWRVLLLDAGAIVLSLAIPFTGVGAALGMAPLPVAFLAVLPLVVLGYAVLVLLARRAYVRRFGRLL